MRTELSGCAIINNKEELLLLWKKNRQHYEFPGGKVEKNESIIEAAKREVLEELGCEVDIVSYIGYEDFDIDNKFFRSHKYLAKIKDGYIPKIMEPEKFDNIFWMPINEYEKYQCAPNVKIMCQKYKDGILNILKKAEEKLPL